MLARLIDPVKTDEKVIRMPRASQHLHPVVLPTRIKNPKGFVGMVSVLPCVLHCVEIAAIPGGRHLLVKVKEIPPMSEQVRHMPIHVRIVHEPSPLFADTSEGGCVADR